MAKEVEHYVKSCPHCLRFKRLSERATLNPIETSRPLELVHIDYLTIESIKKMRTTPYRPEGNGLCERFNRTLISMLGTLPEEFKSKWVNHVNTLTYAYNCTRSNATGFSPYYLLYGQHPLLPIDI